MKTQLKRLRSYAKAHGISLVEALRLLLDGAALREDLSI